jgi:hypothetical protein
MHAVTSPIGSAGEKHNKMSGRMAVVALVFTKSVPRTMNVFCRMGASVVLVHGCSIFFVSLLVSGASGAVDVCFLTAHVWILLAAGWTSQVRFFFFLLTPQTGTVWIFEVRGGLKISTHANGTHIERIDTDFARTFLTNSPFGHNRTPSRSHKLQNLSRNYQNRERTRERPRKVTHYH